MKKYLIFGLVMLLVAGAAGAAMDPGSPKPVVKGKVKIFRMFGTSFSVLMDGMDQYGNKYGVSSKSGYPLATTTDGSKVVLVDPMVNGFRSQWFEVFSKNKKISIEKAITGKFLDKPVAGCDLKLSSRKVNKFVSRLNIELPAELDGDLEQQAVAWEKCSSEVKSYITGGGLSYFLYDSRYPDRYAYLSIGNGVTVPSDKKLTPWNDTFKFVPARGWLGASVAKVFGL